MSRFTILILRTTIFFFLCNKSYSQTECLERINKLRAQFELSHEKLNKRNESLYSKIQNLEKKIQQNTVNSPINNIPCDCSSAIAKAEKKRKNAETAKKNAIKEKDNAIDDKNRAIEDAFAKKGIIDGLKNDLSSLENDNQDYKDELSNANNQIDALTEQKDRLKKDSITLIKTIDAIGQPENTTLLFLEYKPFLSRKIYRIPIANEQIENLTPDDKSIKKIKNKKIRAKRVRGLIVLSTIIGNFKEDSKDVEIKLLNETNKQEKTISSKMEKKGDYLGTYKKYIINQSIRNLTGTTNSLKDEVRFFKKRKSNQIFSKKSNYVLTIKFSGKKIKDVNRAFWLD